MKRSEINREIDDAVKCLEGNKFKLPRFAYWNAKQWKAAVAEQTPATFGEIFEGQLGWDVTDFGEGAFQKFGLVLFTVRNGVVDKKKRAGSGEIPNSGKTYCEKVMIVKLQQRTPMHFHFDKMEDIICRGGSNLCLQLYNAVKADGSLDKDSRVTVSVDGIRRTLDPGATLVLTPGESVTLPPFLYHHFWAESATEACLMGEVSLVNDDDNDNKFLEPIGRFPTIVEDEEPRYLLTKDYAKILTL